MFCNSQDVPKEDLEAILDYMYAGTVKVAHSGLASLLHTAEGLKVKGLIISESLRAPLSRELSWEKIDTVCTVHSYYSNWIDVDAVIFSFHKVYKIDF